MGALQERGSGVLTFVRKDFGVGQPGVVVDRGVQVGVAEPGAAPRVGAVTCGGGAVEFPASTTLCAPAAAVGNVAELLDVDVDQVAGMGVFVAADRFSGSPVEMGQAGDARAAQDRVAG